jgi:hypothetical protein
LGLSAFLVWIGLRLSHAPLQSVITVKTGSTLTSFIPIHMFGNNTADWMSREDLAQVRGRVEAAGNYFLRYPGGSASDTYHWNGQGLYDANGGWAPSRVHFSPGFIGSETYLGTTSSNSKVQASRLDDGDPSTVWLSNTDTDFPNYQWAYLDMAVSRWKVKVNAVTLVWGNAVKASLPYAVSLKVQYWTGSTPPGPFQAASETLWRDTSAGLVTGTGGTQGVTFSPVRTRFLRVLLTKSSAGPGGAYALAEFRVYRGATQLSRNVPDGQKQTPAVVSSLDPASSNSKEYPPFDFERYMAYLRSFNPHGIPMITVNMGTGTPQEAAAWVYYANVVKGYGIKYWQVGNELDGNWETGGPLNADDYGRRFLEFYTAMKKADPHIAIAGPNVGSAMNPSNLCDGNTFIQDFFSRLAHDPGGNAVSCLGAVAFDWYPDYKVANRSKAMASPSRVAGFAQTLTGWMNESGVDPTLPVIMGEYNLSPGTPVILNQLADGVWMADWMGEYIRYFGNRGFANLWDILNGSGDHTDPTQGDLGYLDNTAPAYLPHATYWVMQMMAVHWAQAGDSRPHQLVETEVSNSRGFLKVYSDKRPDGLLSILAVNKDPRHAYQTVIHLEGFVPGAQAKEWTFDSSNYAWQGKTPPYNASLDKAPTQVTLASVSDSFPVTFKPYSVAVIQFVPAASR